MLATRLGAWAILTAGLTAPVRAQHPVSRVVAGASLEGPPPQIDGRLLEAVWMTAPPITRFTQRDPVEGALASEATELRILFGDDAVYVGARMWESAPDSVIAHVTRRDQFSQSDWIIISFDTYRDRRTAYEFALNPAGVQRDRYRFRDAESHDALDVSWDAVWEGAASRDPLGWTAEFRIPYSQLRFAAASEQVWGLQVNRFIVRRNEDAYLVHVPKTAPGWVSHFAGLPVIGNLATGPRVELRPYAAEVAKDIRPAGPADPFHAGTELVWRAGGDLKLGLGPNLTLDATVNPDFGQVEADTAVVNLSAFEVRFQEKRPFFLEGNRLLEVGEPNLFYSRRIGAAPRGSSGADYDDSPDATTILGAAKLTGRLPSGLSLAGLIALTSAETARTFDTATTTFGRAAVEPLSTYAVARLLQEFGPSASTVGAILTVVARDPAGSPPLNSLLPGAAYAGALDWNWRVRGGEYRISGKVGFSHLRGEPGALVRLQQSSVRYFQRPDADYVDVDSNRSSLSGYFADLEVAREAGRHWLWRLFGRVISPGFEINDAGFLQRADQLNANVRLVYRETVPWGPLRNYSFAAIHGAMWNFGGVRTGSGYRLTGDLEWRNFWRTMFEFRYRPAALSDRDTRGGPLMRRPASWLVDLGFGTNRFRPSFAALDLKHTRDDLGGDSTELRGSLRFRPSPRWELSLGPRWSAERTMRQYVAVRAGGPEATYGWRYVFARLDRREVATVVRLKYALTPRLSLELSAEPFASAGGYADHGELRAARSDDLLRYGTEGTTIDRDDSAAVYRVSTASGAFTLPNLDFGVRSLRGILVLRWEFRPGSWIYLAWQQNRFADRDPGRLVDPSDLQDAFAPPSDNVFLIKLSYWLSL